MIVQFISFQFYVDFKISISILVGVKKKARQLLWIVMEFQFLGWKALFFFFFFNYEAGDSHGVVGEHFDLISLFKILEKLVSFIENLFRDFIWEGKDNGTETHMWLGVWIQN